MEQQNRFLTREGLAVAILSLSAMKALSRLLRMSGIAKQREMDDDDHEELLDTLLKHSGPVILSGYENELYNCKLKDWYHEETTCYSQVATKKREVLWMNYNPEPYKRPAMKQADNDTLRDILAPLC